MLFAEGRAPRGATVSRRRGAVAERGAEVVGPRREVMGTNGRERGAVVEDRPVLGPKSRSSATGGEHRVEGAKGGAGAGRPPG